MQAISPYFRRISKPVFAEGEQKSDESDPLTLQEIEYDDFLAFARALHLVPQGPSKTYQLVWVAVVADRFLCAPRVLPGLLNNVRLAFGPNNSISRWDLADMRMNVMDTIYLAGLAEDEDLLYRVSKVRHQTNER
jgi:hypothetical protein